MHLHLPWATACLVAAGFAGAQTNAATKADESATASAELVSSLVRLGPVEPFGRPVVINSQARGSRVRGELEALIDQPFRDVKSALADPAGWCAVMILHINNTACRADAVGATPPRIALKISRNYDQPPEQADELDFAFQPIAASAQRLSVRLHAAKGFLGTFDHALMLEAFPAGDARTALRLSYSYGQDSFTDWALQFWLATFGRGKVGFSPAKTDDQGQPRLVGGIRGLLERNLVLYMIAIEAAARTPAVHERSAFRQRLQDYFAATERHPRQLREVDLEGYLALKQPLAQVGMAGAQ